MNATSYEIRKASARVLLALQIVSAPSPSSGEQHTDLNPMPPSTANANVIHADPTKDFFVNMITRDIALEDCIFDLLDNSIDGARRSRGEATTFDGYEARLKFNGAGFELSDNCGGILLSDAIDYAFHFGRRTDQEEVNGGIGLYGIGMKRALFKMGRDITVESHAADESFSVKVDVDEWAQRKEWDFDFDVIPKADVRGTRIDIRKLNVGVEVLLGDQVFRNNLSKLIARDYSFFIAQGFRIFVDDHQIRSLGYQLRTNDDLHPFVEEYIDEGVRIRIVAGLIDELADDIPEDLLPKDVERYGWYVVCNDRVVLAGDKTNETIWGEDGYRVWHPQYNGFAGFLFFNAEDQRKLPWTTTKRELDNSSPLYRRSLGKLKVVTDQFVQYTQRRKLDMEAAKEAEKPASQINVFSYKPTATQSLRLPTFARTVPTQPAPLNIAYKRKAADVKAVKDHLQNQTISLREIGELTFEYYLRSELGK